MRYSLNEYKLPEQIIAQKPLATLTTIFNHMHSEILSAEQSDLFSLLRTARRSGFYLV